MGPSLVRADVPHATWLTIVHQSDMLEIQSASNTKLDIFGTFTLHLPTGKSRTRVRVGVVVKLAVLVLLENTFFDRFVCSIHLDDRKFFQEHSPPVSILSLPKTRNVAKKKENLYLSQEVEENLAPFLMPTPCNSKTITAARKVVPKAMCETPMLASIDAAALIEVVFMKIWPKHMHS